MMTHRMPETRHEKDAYSHGWWYFACQTHLTDFTCIPRNLNTRSGKNLLRCIRVTLPTRKTRNDVTWQCHQFVANATSVTSIHGAWNNLLCDYFMSLILQLKLFFITIYAILSWRSFCKEKDWVLLFEILKILSPCHKINAT